jgi:hypothetical protein
MQFEKCVPSMEWPLCNSLRQVNDHFENMHNAEIEHYIQKSNSGTVDGVKQLNSFELIIYSKVIFASEGNIYLYLIKVGNRERLDGRSMIFFLQDSRMF